MNTQSNLARARTAMGQPETPPAEPRMLDVLKSTRMLTALRDVATAALPAQKLVHLAVSTISRSRELQQCSLQSVAGAMMTAGAMGLEPNTPSQHGWLIPRKTRVRVGNQWTDAYECTFMVGYRGLVAIAYRSPLIRSIDAHVVHEHDEFEVSFGLQRTLHFRPNFRADRGEPIAVFCAVELSTGGFLFDVMSWRDVLGHRERYSDTFTSLSARAAEGSDQRAARKLAETPWESAIDEMAKKTVFRRLAKWLPLEPATLSALQTASEGAITVRADVTGAQVRDAIDTGDTALLGLDRSDDDEFEGDEQTGEVPAPPAPAPTPAPTPAAPVQAPAQATTSPAPAPRAAADDDGRPEPPDEDVDGLAMHGEPSAQNTQPAPTPARRRRPSVTSVE